MRGSAERELLAAKIGRFVGNFAIGFFGAATAGFAFECFSIGLESGWGFFPIWGLAISALVLFGVVRFIFEDITAGGK